MFEKFEQIRQWSESHTSYELCSLSKIIIYELLLNFNEVYEIFEIYSIISLVIKLSLGSDEK